MAEEPLNIDEETLNRDWLKSAWDRELPPYKTDAFFKEIESRGMSLTEFKQHAIYLRALRDGLVVDDEWTGEI